MPTESRRNLEKPPGLNEMWLWVKTNGILGVGEFTHFRTDFGWIESDVHCLKLEESRESRPTVQSDANIADLS